MLSIRIYYLGNYLRLGRKKYKLYFLISRFQRRRAQLKKNSKNLQKIIDYIETYYNLYIKKKWSSDTYL